jgi:autotransporter-associated beta strand protein
MRFQVLGSNLFRFTSVLLASLIFLFPAATSQAVSLQWDPAGGPAGVWDLLTSNWYDAGPLDTTWVTSDDAIFGAGVLGAGNPWTTGGLVTASGISVGSMTFNIGGYEVAGTATLTGTPVITVTNLADTATISAALSGTVGFSKSGSGTLTLSGANTGLSGPVTLNAGTLNINNNNALGTAVGALVINGGTINNTSLAAVTTTNKTQNWNGDFTFTGTQDLNLGTGAITLGGTAGQRTVTVNAGKLTVGSIPTATVGYGLTKAGTGILRLSGSAANKLAGTLDVTGTLQTTQDLVITGLTGTGNIRNGNVPTYLAPNTTWNDKWFTVNNAADFTFAGTITSGDSVLLHDTTYGASVVGLTKQGTGKLTLTNSGNVINDEIQVSQGTLVFTGTHNNTTQNDVVGNSSGYNAILDIQPGATFGANRNTGQAWNSSIDVAATAGAAGVIRMSGSTSQFTVNRQISIGYAGYGSFNQSGGSTSVGGFIALGGNTTNGGGIINQSGGTITLTAAPITVGYVGTAGRGLLNLSGSAIFNANAPAGNGVWIGENGTAVLNISDTAALIITSAGGLAGGGGLVLGRGNTTLSSGTVNLLGGTITTPFVTRGTGTGILNFNGGTLKANGANTSFLTGLTNVYVNGAFGAYSGGGTIDNGGFAITIDQALIAPPTGNGVSASGLTVSGGGYIDTPVVTITNAVGDTTGTGATAVATINPTTGALTGITMTTPGVGYTAAPTFALVGGGIGNTGAIGGAASLAASASGGMTFAGSGAGVTTLTAVSTYTGPTTVSSGALLLSGSASINTSSDITISGSGAKLVQTSATAITPTVTVTNGTLGGTATVNNVLVSDGPSGIVANDYNGGTGALTIGSLTFNGAGTISLNTASTSPVLNVTGALKTRAVNPAGIVTVNVSNTSWNIGDYDLISYGSLDPVGTIAAFLKGTVNGLGSRQSASLLKNDAVGKYIYFTISGENPMWTGAIVSPNAGYGEWTTAILNAPKNWTRPTLGTTDYQPNDTVLFDDSATGTTSVNIVDASVSPAKVTFNNTGLTYTISGNPIAGTGSLNMTGGGITTLNNNNTYTGGTTVSAGTLTLAGNNTTTGATTVNSGTLNINNANALGTGALTMNGGAIDNTSGAAIILATTNAQNWNGDFAFGGTKDLDLGANNVPLTASRTITTNGAAKLIVSSVISGTGFGIGKAGTGKMVISGANTYTGSTIINAGTLEISGGTTGDTNANIQISPNLGDNGTLLVSGGIVNADRVIIGGNNGNNGTPGDGTLTLTNGTINSREWFTVGSGGGSTSPKGTLNMSGGTINLATTLFEVTDFTNTTAEVNMSGGAINLQTNTSLVYASNSNCGSGTFNQTGGTVTFYSDAGTTIGGTGMLQLGRSGTLPTSSVYTYNLSGGTLIVPEITRNTAAGNVSQGVFNFNGGTLKAAKATPTWMHDLTNAVVTNGGAIIDDGGYNVTISQNISTDGTGGGLTKLGTGTLTLSGTNYWYGPTVVNAGTLAVTVAIDSTSAVTINGGTLLLSGTGAITTSGGGAITIDGAGAKMVHNSSTALAPNVTVTNGTLDGTGTITNTVTVGNGTGGIIANGNGGTGAFTIGSLTFSGVGSISLNTASTSPVLVTTTLTTSFLSTDKITLNAANSSWTSGTTYDLISYSSLLGVGYADFLKGTISGLTPRQSATLSNPAGFIALTISAVSGGNPIWTGKVNNKWTTTPIGGLGNWQIGGVSTDFLTGDAVIFDDTATANTAVDISDANVSPTSATFNNATKNYTISSLGGFGIASGYLAKSGTGTLTITTSNTYAGGTTVNAGTLNINNASAIGTGPLTITGGKIDATAGNTVLTTNNAQNWNGDFTFTGTNSLNVGTGDVTLGGTVGQRTVTVTAGTLAVGSINPIVATPSLGLTKAGAGTLSLTGTAASNIDGTLNVTAGKLQIGANDLFATGLTGGGTVENGSATTRWLQINNAADNTFSGILQDGAGGGLLGLNKNGTGTLTLTGSNNYSHATNVQEGTLVFSGTTNNTAVLDSIGSTASANGILILTPGSSFTAGFNSGAIWNSSLNIGTNGSGAGAIRVVAGSSLAVNQQLAVGDTSGAYGALTQTGGSTTVGGFLTLGLAGSQTAINISGGTFTMTGAPVTNGAGGTNSIGVLNLSGTAAFISNASDGSGGSVWIAEGFSGTVATGILNVSDSATMTINNSGLIIGKEASSVGTVNLLGGTVAAQKVFKGTGSGYLNFNGGTLKATAASTTFMEGLNSAYVYSGGAKIDDGGYAITIAQPLLAATGSGVSATGVTVSGGGYIDTPVVTVSGDGTGATAVANIDALGNLTGITITNPGTGYSTAPTFTLWGGGIGNTGAIGGTALLVANSSAGLTKLGTGTLTLGGTNTYTGDTTISSGTLQAAITASLPNYATAGKVKVSTGATIAVNVGGATEWLAADVNTLDSNAAFSGGSFIGFDTTNATGSFTYPNVVANPLSGTKGLQKLGTNSLILNVTETYTGATVINNGTLELASTGQIATASAISTAATTATFQIDGGTHTVGNISGVGTTNLLAGSSLTATSVVQGTVTLGVGARLTIAPIPGGPTAGAGSLTAVPEPSTWAMLMLAAMGLGMYWRRSR